MPSPPGYVRDIKQEKKTEKARGEYPKILARNRARTAAIKAGRVERNDGKDLAHKKAVSKGGSNAQSNLRVESASKNRSFPRKSDGSMK